MPQLSNTRFLTHGARAEDQTNESIKHLSEKIKEEIIPSIYSIFQKIKAEGILFNSFNEARITLLSKPDKDITKNNRLISLMNIDTKIPNRLVANQVQHCIKKLYTMTPWNLLQVCKAGKPLEIN